VPQIVVFSGFSPGSSRLAFTKSFSCFFIEISRAGMTRKWKSRGFSKNFPLLAVKAESVKTAFGELIDILSRALFYRH